MSVQQGSSFSTFHFCFEFVVPLQCHRSTVGVLLSYCLRLFHFSLHSYGYIYAYNALIMQNLYVVKAVCVMCLDLFLF